MYTLTTILLSVVFSMPVAKKDSINVKPLPESLRKVFEQIIKQPEKSKDYEIEIDGLLVDDTKTKLGKDFYDAFYSHWEVPANSKNYIITISEKPFRLTSTLIEISINDTPVYQSILQPRQDILEELSVDAISVTQNYLINYQDIMRQINGDDMTGTGIF